MKIIAVSGKEDIDAVRTLFQEYADSLPVDLEYQGFPSELKNLPGAYQAPDGGLFIARAGEADAGCVAIRRIDERVCEMKRLYVRPEHRGAGVGPMLVEKVIETARALGYEEMWLDTLASMTDAQRMYVSRGFREIAPYGGTSPPGTRYYGLILDNLAGAK